MEEAKAMLKNLGLTEYESKAYVTLVKFGILTAEKISELGQIPLPRVYDTITELQKKGFVLVSRTRPKKFRAVEIKKALESFIETQKKEAEEKLKNLRAESDPIAAALSAIQKISFSEDSEDVWAVAKKVNIQRTIFDLIKNSKREILVFSGDLSWITTYTTIVKSVLRKNIKIRVLVRSALGNKEIEENIKKAKKMGVQVREGFTGNMRAFIFDDEKVALTKKTPIGNRNDETGVPGTEDKFKYRMMEISDVEIVGAIKQNFEFWWEKLR